MEQQNEDLSEANINENRLDKNEKENDDLNCIICSEIFYRPVTLNCGHTYCKPCCVKSLKIKPVCPICRAPHLSDPQNLKENTTLRNILETHSKYLEKERKYMKIEQKEKTQKAAQEQLQQQQKITEPFQNLFTVQLQNEVFLFPQNTEIVRFYMDCSAEDFGSICPDRTIALINQKQAQKVFKNAKINQEEEKEEGKQELQQVQKSVLGVKGEVRALKHLGGNKYRAEVRIIHKLNIFCLEKFDLDVNLPQQNQEQQNNNNNEQQQQQQNSHSLNFSVCRGEIILQDDFEKISEEAVKNLQETGKNILDLVQFFSLKIAQQNDNNDQQYMMDQTSQRILQKIGETGFQGFLPYKQALSLKQLYLISQAFSGAFSLPHEVKQQLFEADELIERMIILWQNAQKLENSHNLALVFCLEEQNGQGGFLADLGMSFKSSLILICIGVLILLYFYFTKDANTLKNIHKMNRHIPRRGNF